MDCHIEQSGIIAHKSFGHGFSQNLSGKNIRSENMAIIVRFFFGDFLIPHDFLLHNGILR